MPPAKSPTLLSETIVQADAITLAQRIHARDWSCREVMAAYLGQIERHNPTVNAIVSMVAGDQLLLQATERDAQLARGESMGWMHGFPQAIKDLTATAGIVTTFGSAAFANFVPSADALMVKRMKASGAILIGKTNTPEFGLGSQTYNSVFGTTHNAYDARLTAGGSSGGAACALALRMLPVADGSDMMGSLRNPAAFNNVFGLRPSIGRVPNAPAPDIFTHQLGTAGPMARTVRDLAYLLSVQAGYDSQVPTSIQQDPLVFREALEHDFSGARLGWLGDFNGYLPMQPGVLALCEDALHDFKKLGGEVSSAQPAFALERLWQCWLTLRHWSIANGPLGDLYASPSKRRHMKPEAVWEVEAGLSLNAAEVHRAIVMRSAWYQALRSLFSRYDYLLLPAAQVFPFDAAIHWPTEIDGKTMDTYHRWMEVVIAGTLSGCPVASVPAGFNADGLPMGMQIIGKPQADFQVLQLAYAHEQATHWVDRRPPPRLATR